MIRFKSLNAGDDVTIQAVEGTESLDQPFGTGKKIVRRDLP